MNDNEPSDEDYIPPELIESAKKATNDTMPAKSKLVYEKCFNDFCEWQKHKKQNRAVKLYC